MQHDVAIWMEALPHKPESQNALNDLVILNICVFDNKRMAMLFVVAEICENIFGHCPVTCTIRWYTDRYIHSAHKWFQRLNYIAAVNIAI